MSKIQNHVKTGLQLSDEQKTIILVAGEKYLFLSNRGRLGRERKIASRGETEEIDSRRRAPIGEVLLK